MSPKPVVNFLIHVNNHKYNFMCCYLKQKKNAQCIIIILLLSAYFYLLTIPFVTVLGCIPNSAEIYFYNFSIWLYQILSLIVRKCRRNECK